MARYDIKALRRKFKEFDRKANQLTSNVVQSSADVVVLNAKLNAPENNGPLRASINSQETNNGLGAVIFAAAPYAGFVEFGTGGRVSVPNELMDVANSIRNNPKKSFQDMLIAIKDWMRNKGIGKGNEDSVAYLIAVSILKNGIKPSPFLWPAFVQERPKVPKKIDKALRLAADEFNKSR